MPSETDSAMAQNKFLYIFFWWIKLQIRLQPFNRSAPIEVNIMNMVHNLLN